MEKTIESIRTVISKFDEVVGEYNDVPVSGSQFETEFSNYPDRTRITEAFSFGRLSLRTAYEQMNMLPNAVQNNIFSTAVISRSTLEASSLAIWFLDTSINATERVRRGLIQLCDGKAQVKKIFVDSGRTADVARIEDFFANRLPIIQQNLGIVFTNAGGIPILPHKIKPSIFDLIGQNYNTDMQSAYRILSGFAHAQTNVLFAFGYDFNSAPSINGLREGAYQPKPEIILYCLSTAMKSFQKAVETHFQISGWDFTKIKPSFDDFFKSLFEFVKNNKS